MCRKRAGVLLLPVLFFLFPSSVSLAEFKWDIASLQQTSPGGKVYAEISIRSIPVIRLYSNSGAPAFEKAKVIEKRLRAFLQLQFSPSQLRAGKYGDQFVVAAGSYLIVTVSHEEAKFQGTTARLLAEKWALSLRAALTLPTLQLQPYSLVIPLGEIRRIRLNGTAKGALTFSGHDTSVISVAYDPGEKTILVQGKQIGDSVVMVQREGVESAVKVAVRAYAGAVAPVLREAQVTGSPCPRHIIVASALRNIPDSLILQADASYKILTKQIQSPERLKRGESGVVKIPVKIFGEDYVPVTRTISISVQNEALLPQEASYLAVSNHPENIAGPGVLLETTVMKDYPVRLLYHHKNVNKYFLFDFLILLYNPGDAPVSVQLIRGSPSPSRHELSVGKLAAGVFLDNYSKDVGEILRVPPKSFLTLYKKQIPRNHVLSGIFYLRCLSGDMVYVQVKAKQGYDTDTSTVDPFTLEPSARKGIFHSPQFYLEKVYTAGDKWLFINVGDNPLVDMDSGLEFRGNYGVFYNVSVTLNNPTEKKKKILFYFEPAGGVASGIFYLDGKNFEVGPVNYPHERKISHMFLAPYESRTVMLQTMPLSGSNYPVRIIVRS